MSAAVEVVIDRVLLREGGIEDLEDGKGVTRFGQTPEWLATWDLPAPQTPEQAAANYEAWMNRTGLTQIVEQDVEVGDLVVDMAVHSGVIPAVKMLQAVLRVPDDGVIGPVTMRALRDAGRRGLLHRFLAARIRFIGRLLGSMEIDRRRWARGWCNRLADQLETLS